MDWDDLKIAVAVRDSGTFAGAGARLRLDETTVARRLARLQKSLGVSLFEAIDNSDPSALIGLPLIALARLLREAGIALP